MIRTYYFESEREWDEGISFLLFAVRESIQESLGFSPFELIFGNTVRGPLKLLRDEIMGIDEKLGDVTSYVSNFHDTLKIACDLAKENLKNSQIKMKLNYDKKKCR